MDSGLQTAIIAFNALNGLGLGLVTCFFVLSATISRTSRLSTWYLILAFSGILALDLVLSIGIQDPSQRPEYVTCLFQSSLMYAAAAGIACSVAAFTFQLYLSLRFFILNTSSRFDRNSIAFTLFPMLIFMILVLLAVVIAASNPEAIGRESSNMYCHMRDSTPVKVTGAIVIICGIAILVLQGMIAKIVYPHWQETAKLHVQSSGLVSRSMLIRLILWDLTALISVAIGVLKSATDLKSPTVNVLIACINLCEILAFGSAALPTIASLKSTPSTGSLKLESPVDEHSPKPNSSFA